MNFSYCEIFIAISTDKIETLSNFYSGLLQREPDVYRPSIYAEFQLEKLKIAIFKPKSENKTEFKNLGSAMSLCLEVDNLEAAISAIAALGQPPVSKIIEASHGREIMAYDPDGNRLILHEAKKTRDS